MTDYVKKRSLTGSTAFKFSPIIKNITPPGSHSLGWFVEIFGEDPDENPNTQVVVAAIAEKELIDIPESFQSRLPKKYFVRARSAYTADSTCCFRFGLSTSGKGKLKINGNEVIDLWTSQPPKTDSTPCFNRLSMERYSDIDVTEGQILDLEVILVNEDVAGGVGTALTLAGRVGGFEVIDEDEGIKKAVALAKEVDVPIIVTGLSSDYECEGSDRKHLRLPGRTDEMIKAVLEANPDTVSRSHVPGYFSG